MANIGTTYLCTDSCNEIRRLRFIKMGRRGAIPGVTPGVVPKLTCEPGQDVSRSLISR